MLILCTRLVEKDGGILVEAHERYNKRHNCAVISVYFKEWAVRAVALAHSRCVLIGFFWAMEKDCRGWASLDMSFRTLMLFHCSIFIHLQVSNRPSGQHIVSLPVSSEWTGHMWWIGTIWSHLLATLPSPLRVSPLLYPSSLLFASPSHWMQLWLIKCSY